MFDYFNSIKVRLKQNYEKNLSIRQTNFNSIKVRLKPELKTSYDRFDGFQFHKGTIKTRFPERKRGLARIAFQFHKGTIKTRGKAERRMLP